MRDAAWWRQPAHGAHRFGSPPFSLLSPAGRAPVADCKRPPAQVLTQLAQAGAPPRSRSSSSRGDWNEPGVRVPAKAVVHFHLPTVAEIAARAIEQLVDA